MERGGTGGVMAAPGTAAVSGGQAGGPAAGRALARLSPQGENGVGGRAVRVGTRRSQVGGMRSDTGFLGARVPVGSRERGPC